MKRFLKLIFHRHDWKVINDEQFQLGYEAKLMSLGDYAHLRTLKCSKCGREKHVIDYY